MKTAEEWDNYFRIEPSTWRQKSETLWDWERRRYKMIQDDARKSELRLAIKHITEIENDWQTQGSEVAANKSAGAQYILTKLEKQLSSIT